VDAPFPAFLASFLPLLQTATITMKDRIKLFRPLSHH
jgi:hypothetical protein